MPLTPLLDRVDPRPLLDHQHHLRVNFDDHEVDDTWHHDVERTVVANEAPGPPEPDGAWATGCRLVAAYEFTDPRRVRAVYDATRPLLGRDMLLEGRFSALRFYMGVRVTHVIDERRPVGSDGTTYDRVWGWSYETLEGHLERGRLSYELVKHEGSGQVELVIRSFSLGAPWLGPVTRLGWRLFGRRAQLRFYRNCGRRLTAAIQARTGHDDPIPPRRTFGGLVLAPSDASSPRWHRASIRRQHPG